jgi:hypothetical protein
VLHIYPCPQQQEYLIRYQDARIGNLGPAVEIVNEGELKLVFLIIFFKKSSSYPFLPSLCHLIERVNLPIESLYIRLTIVCPNQHVFKDWDSSQGSGWLEKKRTVLYFLPFPL